MNKRALVLAAVGVIAFSSISMANIAAVQLNEARQTEDRDAKLKEQNSAKMEENLNYLLNTLEEIDYKDGDSKSIVEDKLTKLSKLEEDSRSLTLKNKDDVNKFYLKYAEVKKKLKSHN